MTTRWFGAPVQRLEDERLLRGKGRYTDDIGEGALEYCFVRSPHAHARITSIDASAARALPGVAAIYTAADLPFGGLDLPLLIPHPNLTHGRTQRCLATDVVRYAGEAVAFVVATSRYVAAEMLQEVGNVDAAMASAPRRQRLHFRYERGAASPMEARAVWARWSPD